MEEMKQANNWQRNLFHHWPILIYVWFNDSPICYYMARDPDDTIR